MAIRHCLTAPLLFGLLLSLISLNINASPVLKLTLPGAFEANYARISEALEENRFYIIFEPNIGRSLANYRERWGEDYNRNGFSEVRSLVFCNPWYANQVLNQDPEMAALCPLSVTLLQKDEQTQILFLRPGQIKPESPAQQLLEELEQDVIKALRQTGAE